MPSVLIVDGDADSRLLYRMVLSEVADVISEAEDGAEALGMAICQRPDVILTDSRLKRIDGYQLCTLLRREPLTQCAGILIITAGAYPDDLERAADAGADEVLIKPLLPDALVDATYRTWRRRHPNGDGNHE